MDQTHVLIVCTVALAIVFDLTNGWNDASNAIATVVSTRVLGPMPAVIFGALLNFVGAFFSSEVAKTVGKEIANPEFLTPATYLAAVVVAPVWITACTFKGLPISCSHSLMGGLIGSVLACAGADALHGAGIKKIVFGVFVSPIGGFFLGMGVLLLVAHLFRRVKASKATRLFEKLQLASAGYMAFSHGTGDAQKAMGIITGALIAGGWQEASKPGEFHIQSWVRILCATAMGVGSAVGGWKVMKTLGSRLAHLKPHQGFAAEMGAATTIVINTLSGVPISTTHSITGSIMGVGAAHGLRTVRWGVGKKIVYAWVLTFPACIGGGYLVRQLFGALGFV
jgi:PiT family inorganic phosphate transporter